MYEKLLREAEQQGVDIYEVPMTESIKGLYGENIIWINKKIESQTERACVLAEELGHHVTSAGHILDQSCILNRKQEQRARRWAFEKLVPLTSLIEAFKSGVRTRFELAEYLNVTETFLGQALQYYKNKYGLYKKVDQYTILFEPLLILELCG